MPKLLYHPPWHGAAASSVSLWGIRCYKFTACLKSDILVNVLRDLALSIPGFCLILQIGKICAWGLKQKTRKDHLWLHTLTQSPREYLQSAKWKQQFKYNITVFLIDKITSCRDGRGKGVDMHRGFISRMSLKDVGVEEEQGRETCSHMFLSIISLMSSRCIPILKMSPSTCLFGSKVPVFLDTPM